MPGARRARFALPRLPPLPALVPLLAAAEAASQDGRERRIRGARLAPCQAVAAALADGSGGARRPTARHERQITAALRRIEAAADAALSLAELAREAGMSPYHFLRLFRGLSA